MSASTTHSKEDTGSIWSILNIAFATLIAGFALYWGLVLLVGSVNQSFIARNAEATVVSNPAASTPAAPAPTTTVPAPTEAPVEAGVAAAAGDVFEITIKPAGAAGMEYDIKAFTVKKGQTVKITFENQHPIPQPHNIVVGKPNTKDKLMMAAMQMAADPKGMEKGYVPDSDDVLFHTKLLQPTQSEILEFVAPADPGAYTYICTFPGHALLMNGVMTVE